MSERELTHTATLQALLGAGTEFEGKLFFGERVRVDGKLRGSIQGDGLLIVGDGADIDADIQVGALIVRGGSVRGRVHAKQAIEIHKVAEVYADLAAPAVDIEKGCTFEGRMTITGTAANGQDTEQNKS